MNKFKLLKKYLLSDKNNVINYSILKKEFGKIKNNSEEYRKTINTFNNTKLFKSKKFKDILQITGTGGDTLKTINVSTLSAMVMASMGFQVIKTGSKAYTGLMGASDFFLKFIKEFNLDKCLISNPDQALKRFNFYFAYVPKYYPWIKKINKMRNIFGKEIFNKIFDEMHRNEMNSQIKIIGTSSKKVKTNLKHFMRYGYKKLLIIHGLTQDNKMYLDEASNLGKTQLSYLLNNEIKELNLSPSDFRDSKEIRIKSIQQIDKDKLYQSNITIIKGIGSKELTDLIAINATVYINFINDFKLNFKRLYKKVQHHIQKGYVFEHFLK